MNNAKKKQARNDQFEDLESISSGTLSASDCESDLDSDCEITEIVNCNNMNSITTSMNDLHDLKIHCKDDVSEVTMMEIIKTEPTSIPNSTVIWDVEDDVMERYSPFINTEPVTSESSSDHEVYVKFEVPEVTVLEPIKPQFIPFQNSTDSEVHVKTELQELPIMETIKIEPISVPNSPVHESHAKSKVKLLYITRPIKVEIPTPPNVPVPEPEGDNMEFETEPENMELFTPFIERPPVSAQSLSNSEVYVKTEVSEPPMMETIKTEPYSVPDSPELEKQIKTEVTEVSMMQSIGTELINIPNSSNTLESQVKFENTFPQETQPIKTKPISAKCLPDERDSQKDERNEEVLNNSADYDEDVLRSIALKSAIKKLQNEDNFDPNLVGFIVVDDTDDNGSKNLSKYEVPSDVVAKVRNMYNNRVNKNSRRLERKNSGNDALDTDFLRAKLLSTMSEKITGVRVEKMRDIGTQISEPPKIYDSRIHNSQNQISIELDSNSDNESQISLDKNKKKILSTKKITDFGDLNVKTNEVQETSNFKGTNVLLENPNMNNYQTKKSTSYKGANNELNKSMVIECQPSTSDYNETCGGTFLITPQAMRMNSYGKTDQKFKFRQYNKKNVKFNRKNFANTKNGLGTQFKAKKQTNINSFEKSFQLQPPSSETLKKSKAQPKIINKSVLSQLSDARKAFEESLINFRLKFQQYKMSRMKLTATHRAYEMLVLQCHKASKKNQGNNQQVNQVNAKELVQKEKIDLEFDKKKQDNNKDEAIIFSKRKKSDYDSTKVAVMKNDYKSLLHHNSAIDCNRPFCSYDLLGVCKDKSCNDQHI